jgi:hypothetical protein
MEEGIVNNITHEEWLLLCFVNWTTSPVYSEAWQYRNDFEGFCKWWLS